MKEIFFEKQLELLQDYPDSEHVPGEAIVKRRVQDLNCKGSRKI